MHCLLDTSWIQLIMNEDLVRDKIQLVQFNRNHYSRTNVGKFRISRDCSSVLTAGHGFHTLLMVSILVIKSGFAAKMLSCKV